MKKRRKYDKIYSSEIFADISFCPENVPGHEGILGKGREEWCVEDMEGSAHSEYSTCGG